MAYGSWLMAQGSWLTAQGSRLRAYGSWGVGICLVLAYAVTARAQASHWATSVTLWEHAARVVPGNYIAYENLGQAFRERGELDAALESYKTALTVVPPRSPALEAMIRNDLGLVLTRHGRSAEARSQFETSVRLK